MKKSLKIDIILGVVLIILLIWGSIGASKVETIKYSCDFGFENGLCWKWHENSLLEIINEGAMEGINRLFGS